MGNGTVRGSTFGYRGGLAGFGWFGFRVVGVFRVRVWSGGWCCGFPVLVALGVGRLNFVYELCLTFLGSGVCIVVSGRCVLVGGSGRGVPGGLKILSD